MASLLIRERYKVVRVIDIRRDYALLEAVDISDRETPACMVNVYEGELLHRYARICIGIQQADCPAFRGMFLEGGALVTVFDCSQGESIDRYFYRGDEWSWQERLQYAEMLLNRALAVSNLPAELSCAALMSENVLFDMKNQRFSLRWKMLPLEEMNPREAALLAADQVKKILPRKLTVGKAQRQFLDELDAGTFRSIPALYGRWREAEQAIRAEEETFASKGFLRRIFILLGRIIRNGLGKGGSK
jgi:hypothetical protein